MFTVFQRWFLAAAVVVSFVAAAALSAASTAVISDDSSTAPLAAPSAPPVDSLSPAVAALAQEIQGCEMHWRCLGELGRTAIAAGQFTELYQALAQDPLVPCHAIAQDSAHAELDSGATMEEVMALVTQRIACQGGYFDGTFGWMGTHGAWKDRARAQSVVDVCSALTDPEIAQACADGAGNGFMQGSASMDEALALCEMFPTSQYVAVCLAQVPQQAFRPTWDKSGPAVHDPSEALEVLEPFCEKVYERHGDAALRGCIDGLSHPLSWEADYTTRVADTPEKVKKSSRLWDEALSKCAQLRDENMASTCTGYLGMRAGFATAVDKSVRQKICESSRPKEFVELCRAVSGR